MEILIYSNTLPLLEMPTAITKHVRDQYLAYFADQERFRIPSRDPAEYNVHEDFFNTLRHARESLISILQSVMPLPGPVKGLEEGIYAEFTITGHAAVRLAPGQESGTKILTGQSALMLAKGTEGTAKAIAQNSHADPNSLVLSSDLGRAIHHAVLKYYPKTEGELDQLADEIEKEMRTNQGTISRDTELYLVGLALDKGIIPTPLLRSHYHGIRDLNPDPRGGFDVSAFMRTELCQNLYASMAEDQVRQVLAELNAMAKQGRDPFQVIEDEEGRTLTENLPLYGHRITQFLRLLSPEGKFYNALKGRKVNIVGHSSNMDIASAYFRHFPGRTGIVLEKADKSETRGQEVVIKVAPDFSYLNDPHVIEEVKEQTSRTIVSFRARSMDELIQKGQGLVDLRFLGFRVAGNRLESYPVSIDEMLNSRQPVLILGDPGQGKTQFAAGLAERILRDESGYVPVLVSLRKLSDELLDPSVDKIVDNILGGVMSRGELVTNILSQEYRFVMVLDGFDELLSDFLQGNMIGNVINELNNHGLVIVTSRYCGFNSQQNTGYQTLNIDAQAIIKNIDAYLETRLPDQTQREGFKQFLEGYDDSIRGNYLMLYGLTRLCLESELDFDNPPTKTEIYEQVATLTLVEHEKRRGERFSSDRLQAIAAERKKMLAKLAFNATVHGKFYTREELLDGVWETWKPQEPN